MNCFIYQSVQSRVYSIEDNQTLYISDKFYIGKIRAVIVLSKNCQWVLSQVFIIGNREILLAEQERSRLCCGNVKILAGPIIRIMDDPSLSVTFTVHHIYRKAQHKCLNNLTCWSKIKLKRNKDEKC